ncbi:sugar-binding protein (plasmid) [Streptomyces anulatus]|uniref:RHS repeat-associated core domain-containing protein n=1 Tax=Streptomyces TaxID=1883 RepID=UPI002F91A2AA
MAVTVLQGAETAIAGPAGQSAQPADKESRKYATEAGDLSSARVLARLSGKRVEALSERTDSSTTWVNKDGSLTTEIAAGPVRFRDDSDQWRDVNVDLEALPDGSVAPHAHPEGLRLSGKTGKRASSLKASQAAPATDLVTLGEGDGQITLQWRGGLPAPELDGTRATYVNAVPGADVIVEATRTGFEQFVELKNPPAAGFSYTLPLRTKGLKVKQQKDGSVLFTDKKSKKTAVMPAPVMWDASVDKASGEHTRRSPVAMKVVKSPGGVDLVVTPDAEFLADPKTQYPVTVDPSTSALGNLFDTYVQQGETTDLSTDTELDLGNPGTTNANGTPRTARSFITWNTAPIADSLVSSAKLSLWNFHSANTDCKAYPWEVWSTGAPATSSRWTAQPAWTAKKATSTETKGNPACGSVTDGWINADVTALAQEWASAKATRGHTGLRATSETVTAQWKRVNSANAAKNPPKLSVTYNHRPRTGTKQEAGPPFFSYAGNYVVNTLTPTLRDTFVDANGDKVNGTFQVYDNVTNTQVGSPIVSKYVASGQAASVTVPAGVLVNGKTYKFRTSPYDGAHYNTGWSAWKTFTVDTSAPSAPTQITSTDYPSGQWVKGAGQPGTFTVTPPAADHNWLEWSLDGVTWTKVVTGGSSAAKAISVTPPRNGTHTLQVRSADKADNKSEAREYIFHAGSGGFSQPSEGERTARRLPLVAEAEAGKYNQVSFSWRRSEADPWVKIPAGDVTSGGTALTAWPVPLVNGKNAPLVWNTTDTVNPDGSIQLKADFTGPNSAASASPALNLVVDRNADGAATTEVGPGSLNLLTGDYTLSETDASAFEMSVTRTASSRVPDKAAKQEGQAPIFGKHWVAGTVAELSESEYSHVRRVSDTAVDVVMLEGDALHFTANAAKTGWVSEPGLESLTLKGTVGTTFTLSDTEGSVTTFTKPDPAATTWQVSSTLVDGLTHSTTKIVSETVTVAGKKLARPKRVIAPTSAVTTAACETAPATKGCRVLEFEYATATTATGTGSDAQFGDFTGQVKQIKLWATAPGAAAATATAVAGYRYDSTGALRQSWDPRVGRQAQTQYAYWGDRVTWTESDGQLPYSFDYGNAGSGSVPNDGMLLNVSRAGLKQGTLDQTEGTAVSTVVYGVPLTGAKAPVAMGAGNVAAWGQFDAPTDATAVFPADVVPTSNSGEDLAPGNYARAAVNYLNVSGRQVNSLSPGANITTTEYDRFGNTVRELTAGNRELALGATDAHKETLTDLGIIAQSSSERAQVLSTTSLYNETGTRELEEFGPLHRVDLAEDLKDGTTTVVPAGTSVPARSWTVKEYDEGRPTNGTATVKDQVTLEITGARVRDHYSLMGEKRVTQTQYDWVKGLPVLSLQDAGGLNLGTSTGYDAQGRVISQGLPGSTGSDAATRITEYWAADGTGWCKGRPEWADQPCWTGPAGAITGGGSQPANLPDTTTEYGYFGQVTQATDTANGTTRTTTTTHDSAARPLKTTVTGGLGQAVPETTNEYDTVTGQITKITSPTAGTITKTYDKLGRQATYTDADGGKTTTEYDLLDRPVKLSDTVPSTTTYTYNHNLEPRGLTTKISDSVAGDFVPSYDADGSLATEKLPGGYTMTATEDPTGAAVSRAYTRDSDGTSLYTDTVTESAHGQVTSHQGWSAQNYKYDKAGRLTNVHDTAGETCTRRTYTFDKRTNRTGLTTATGEPTEACPTTGGTTTTHTYDSADRLVDTGYTYDNLGRTTALPGSTVGYYANDLAHQVTTSTERQTWQLDAALRFRSWTTETATGTTWTQTGAKTNHYDSDSDSPRWITEDTTGTLTRNIESTSGDLAATTTKTGDTVLHLTTIHGDIALQLPLDINNPPVALDSDEYGNPRTGQTPTRYNWLGAKQRSTETPNNLTLMGVRLYNPTTGRFLSIDPVYGGNANAYEYVTADPLNKYDLDGRRWGWISRGWNAAKRYGSRAWNSKPRKWGWKNRWRAVDYGRKYASRGAFVGFGAGLGYCAYKRAWNSCGSYALQGAAAGGFWGSGYGFARGGWRGIKRTYRWYKSRR